MPGTDLFAGPGHGQRSGLWNAYWQAASCSRPHGSAHLPFLAGRVEVLPFITVNYVPFDGEYLP
ncbi:MAG: hypothetical protein H6718_07780 [Polyangiaceae bacterium]|nr:hypothetical protein [Polyangiaceae bacterium]